MASEKRLAKIDRVVGERQRDVIVVLEDIHDPHNAEAIFRTCDAFGVQEVYLIFDKEKAWDPRSIGKSSSSSANKWLDFRAFNSVVDCFKHLKKNKYSIVATALADECKDVFSFKFPNKTALLFGNEHSGLSEYALEHCDHAVMIPMRGMVESLNVSVSAALFLYALTSQRIFSGKKINLSKKELARLADDFSRR